MGTVREDQYTFLIISQIKVVEKVETSILCSVTFFVQKSCHLWDNVDKILQATDGNMAHAHCMPDT